MNINSGKAKLVLLCPAWKTWGTASTVKPDTVILHSRADDVVPFADSEELVENRGLPASALIEVGRDHRLADAEPLSVMEAVVRSFSPPVSFSDDYPFAYHVLPLHALKPIASSGRLLSKADLRVAQITSGVVQQQPWTRHSACPNSSTSTCRRTGIFGSTCCPS
jgi:hypothetical protein